VQRKPRNELFTNAFSRVRAGGSLDPGVSHGEARARAEALALVSKPFTGETKKEPRLFFFTPTFQKEESGFYSFSGFKLEIVRGPRCNK
jgi:hypothetical protein